MTEEFVINDIVVTILVFLFGVGVGVSLRRMIAAAGVPVVEPEPPEHRCPFCGETLRAITVEYLDADADHPIPSGAQWICPDGECLAYYFADRPAAKPAATEEL